MSFRFANRGSIRKLCLLGVLVFGVVLVSGDRSVRAADEVKTGSALSKTPADAAFFLTSLRNKKQIDLFYNSNAYKSIRALPFVQLGYKQLMAKLNEEGGPMEHFKKFTEDKENAELLEVLTGAVADEVFFYGGKSWTDFYRLASKINTSQQFAPLMALLNMGDPEKAQMRAILLELQKQRELIRVPDTIIGFKLKDTKKATAQMDRLGKILPALVKELGPLKDKVKRQKVAGGDFVTAEVDGSLIPWDDANLSRWEEKKDEFADLIKTAKKTTLTVSLGIKDDYLLLGITSTTKDLEKIGGKTTLAERDEMQPLAKYAKKELTGISYASKEFLNSMATSRADIDTLVKNVKEMLDKTEMLKADRKKAMAKDLDAFADELKKAIPEYGASMDFSFMTSTGYEGYRYAYGNHDAFKDVDCKLLSHIGADPVFAAAFGCKCDGTYYKAMVKWTKIVYGHAEAFFLDQAGAEQKDVYEKVKKAVVPVLERIDENTTKVLIPSMAESGLGLVLDSKWSSKQWLKELPEMPKAMPMLELGLLLGVSDGDKFAKAMKTYRVLIGELLEKIGDTAPDADNIKNFKIPAPESEKGKNGTLYFYPIPKEVGFDEQFQPVTAVGKDVSVVTLSKAHAERLMARTPLKMKSGPLTRKGKLIGGSVLNWPAFVDTAAPWVEFGVSSTVIFPADDEDAKKKAKEQAAMIMKQVKVGFEVLKCFKGASSATYLEDGKLVTHTEIVIKDLDKASEPEK